MTVSTARTSRLSTTFQLKVDDYRAHKIPGVDGAKVGSCYIRADDLVDQLDLDNWLAVNPRVPNRNAKDVLTGHVVRGIRETLAENPADFAIKNQGLFLLVDHVGDYDRRGGGGELQITMSDPERHGLCNGGHSYAAIREYAENPATQNGLDGAWVRLHLFEGISPEKVTAMAEGLNRSKQVDDPSLMDLGGDFDDIRDAMKGRPGADEISYHQGDSGSYYITEVIRAIMFFNCARYSSRKHPNALYRQQRKMVKMYAADLEATPSPVGVITPHVHEILQLMDRIAKAVPEASAKLNPPFVLERMKVEPKKGGARAGSQKYKQTPLHFIDDVMDCKIHNGWLMVMLAAFRANVRWNLDNRVFEWKMPIEELLPAVINDLVRICVQEYRDNKAKPDETARNGSVYEQCYDKVELELHRRGHAN